MNKTQLVDKIAEKAGLTKTQAHAAVDAFIATVSEQLCEGEQVALVGFGTFKVSNRNERKGHNPKTGAEIVIPATKLPVFTAGKGLKDSVKG